MFELATSTLSIRKFVLNLKLNYTASPTTAPTFVPSAYPTSRPTSQPAVGVKSSSLSSGAVAGIAIAASAFVIGVLFVFYKYILVGASDPKLKLKDNTANFDTSNNSNSRATTNNPMMSGGGSRRNDITADL